MMSNEKNQIPPHILALMISIGMVVIPIIFVTIYNHGRWNEETQVAQTTRVRNNIVPVHKALRETGACREMYNRPDTLEEGCELIWHVDADDDGWGEPETCWCFYGRDIPDPQKAPRVGDCNDEDYLVNPSSTEVCDGVDNNCDGHIDENPATGESEQWFLDRDDDGYGDLASGGVYHCNDGYEQRVPQQGTGDCDDNDPDKLPGQGCGTRVKDE